MFKGRYKTKTGHFEVEIQLKDFTPGARGLKRMPRANEAIEGVSIYGTSAKKRYIDRFEITFNGKKVSFSEASKHLIFVDEIQDRGYVFNPTKMGNLLVIPSSDSDGLFIQLAWDAAAGARSSELLTWAVTAERGVVLFSASGPP